MLTAGDLSGFYGGVARRRTPAPPPQLISEHGAGQMQRPPAGPPPASVSPYVPQAAPPSVAYEDPTARTQAIASRLAGQGLPPAAVQANLHNQAEVFARRRMHQMQNIAQSLPPELQALLAQQQGIDPAQAWRAISGAFSQYAQGRGYADPRQLLAMSGHQAAGF